MLDDFDSYTSEAALETAWPDSTPSWPVELRLLPSTDGNGGGLRHIALDYDLADGPFLFAERDLGGPQDWSALADVTVWYRGSAANEPGSVVLQVGDADSGCNVGFGSTTTTVWTRIDGDLGLLGTFCLATDPTMVTRIALGVQQGSGAGTVELDDVALDGSVGPLVLFADGFESGDASAW